MTDPDEAAEPMPDDWVLDAVRRRMDRAAEGVDPRPLFERIRPGPSPAAPPARALPRWVGPLLTMAAAVGLVLLGGWFFEPARGHAGPRELLAATQEVHRLPIDRCYLVDVRRSPQVTDLFPNAPLLQTSRLWTRGDRFFLVPGDGRIGRAWGRDENGNLWIAPTPRAGVRVESREIPAALATMLEMHTLRVDQVLGEVLQHFDLTRVEEADEGLATSETVRAVPRRGAFAFIRWATLEVDRETKVLRRLVIARGPFGKAPSITTYTLVETRALETARYSLEGHLREPFEVYTRQHQPDRWLAELRKMYGPMADRWFGPK